MSFTLSSERFDANELLQSLSDSAAGACVTFEGWVRNENEGRDVLRLEYESYEVMAMKEGNRIMEEACEKFGLISATCVHRVGLLEIGDMAVWVGVSSGHRGEAFDACRYIIDEVKHRTPIWKKEFYTDGDSGWVKCEACAEPDHVHSHTH
jgi:molybdopterin synthase catalytic subunit